MIQSEEITRPTPREKNPVGNALVAATALHPGVPIVGLSGRSFGKGITDAVIFFEDGFKTTRVILLDAALFQAYAIEYGFEADVLMLPFEASDHEGEK